ncbi:MAG: hypothetical protein LKJ60_04725 [Lentilactobacillus buchneri]|jgi:hypothetical protein|nr:hypothetical protein [Lentilactobacillus buchneri]
MAIQTNAQRITRIYRGTTKVWEDTSRKFISISPVGMDPTYNELGVLVDENNPAVGYLMGWFQAKDNPINVGDVIGTFKEALVTPSSDGNSGWGDDDITSFSNMNVQLKNNQLICHGYSSGGPNSHTSYELNNTLTVNLSYK